MMENEGPIFYTKQNDATYCNQTLNKAERCYLQQPNLKGKLGHKKIIKNT